MQNNETCIGYTIQDMYLIHNMYWILKTYRQTNNIKTNDLFTKYITIVRVYTLITCVITWESHIPTGYEPCTPCLTSHITTTRLYYTTLYWYYTFIMDLSSTQDIYTLNRTELHLFMSLEHLSRTNTTCCKPSNVLKHFRHNIA